MSVRLGEHMRLCLRHGGGGGNKDVMVGKEKAKADLLPHPPPPPHRHQSWMTRGLRPGLRWQQRQS